MAAEAGSSQRIQLYVWPKLWDLPSFDPYCLTAILYLQLAIPGDFTIIECTDVDLSPSGQLPFLVHGTEVVTSFASILKYVSGLAETEGNKYPNANTDKHLSPKERSQRNAWLAHVEANLGDLVASTFYSADNWDKTVHKAFSSLFPVPQRYFVPSKLRAAYQPRLEAAGLWSDAEPAPDKKSVFEESSLRGKQQKSVPKIEKNKGKFTKIFEKEKFIAKSKKILDLYARLLEGKQYVFDSITSIDVAIAAHTVLLIQPRLPDDTINKLVTETYPALLAHSERVKHRVLPGPNNPPFTYETYRRSLCSFLLPFWGRSAVKKDSTRKEKTPEERQVDRMRWAFVGLALGSLAAYIAVVGQPFFQFVLVKMQELEAAEELEYVEDDEWEEDDEEIEVELPEEVM
ncbi:hypothetical protein CC1G_01189 [Coprinopsis cinerea okayama7|uniref:Mitochondrial outer membrane transport complex Sam37/metaxin N-terminal domain-containing protein n=1 Tax=Coprinopsis cinerea (strain Okayama-7 / 130 / ATCC MYA-4618 / FGSC 9003) TaxID=240176 RepID=A8NEU0_COPC7|nr:hypothetical protein CC1G_01189 [Coprinopsis cinerea okayama7\|eukprot:XP_001833127.1 hypothetical protein CC1G_01189 [Coprinopsis cinerea okayama7\